MNYFFVFQNKTFEQEMRGGYLWSPKLNKIGNQTSHYNKMTQVKKGDVIIHSFRKKIIAISVAKTDCYSSNQPIELGNQWDNDGWRVDTQYYLFRNCIMTSDHMPDLWKLQPSKDAPFNYLQRGNTGYLYEANKKMLDYILHETQKIQNTDEDKEYVRSILTKKLNSDKRPKIRIVTLMSPGFKDKTVLEIQKKLFLNEIPKQNFTLPFKDRLIDVQDETTVLFQINGAIIASARIKQTVFLETKTPTEPTGYMKLYPESIRVFDPISYSELKAICPIVESFEKPSQNLDAKYLKPIFELIEKKAQNYSANELAYHRNQVVTEKEARSLSRDDLLKRVNRDRDPKPITQTTVNVYYRDQYLKELVKLQANGVCQLCNSPAPFKDTDGKPYLEIHHIEQLAKGGKDVIENTVALCPNCHRKVHVLEETNDIQKLKKLAKENAKLISD